MCVSQVNCPQHVPANIFQSKTRVIALTIAAVVAVALIVLGYLNVAGVASLFVFISGCIILQLCILAVVLFAILVRKPALLHKSEEKIVPLEKVKDIPDMRLEIVPPLPIGIVPLFKRALAAPLPHVEQTFVASEDIENQAVCYAREQLEQHRDTIIPKGWGTLTPPVNPDIALVAALRDKKFQEICQCLNMTEDLLYSYPESSIRKQRFDRIAFELMSLAFLESRLTLREILEQRDAHPEKTCLQITSDPSSALSLTFYALQDACHLVSCLHVDCKDPLPETTITAIQAKFEQEGTLEHSCRLLYDIFRKEVNSGFGIEEVSEDN
ncbi:hypothetical protein [Chlamydia vaughanii]|uniref:hypothetical protein n=1 Tax=Chlamydia vaughanii TaxID=3112552 RepID=UPI0032B14FD5